MRDKRPVKRNVEVLRLPSVGWPQDDTCTYESVSRLEFRRFFLGLEMAGPLLMAHFSFPVPELLAFGFYALRRRLR
jgi:hypothetical protein